MHVPLAELCIDVGTPMVTASYVSDAMQTLHARATQANVPILCEMGLDPGMDHMSAVELIERAHALGGVVTSFTSNCGGLPSPEVASTTPFGYKFSWSPAGVIAATRNDARYRERGRVVSVAGGAPLLAAATPLTSGRLGRTLRLEVIPNRDSLPYARLYGIEHEAQTVSRGTLRYQGWCALFGTFDAMGLSSAKAAATPVPAGLTTWSELLSSLGVHPPKAHSAASSSSSSSTSSTSSASSSAAAASAASEGASEGASERAVRSALSSLGVWSAEGEAIGQHASIADAFCALLSRKLSYGPQERDACLLEHTVRVEFPQRPNSPQRPTQIISSSLVAYGSPGGPTSMSRTVGLTAALGVHRVLETALPPLSGVLRPVQKSVYEFCLPRLAAEGLSFEEHIEFE